MNSACEIKKKYKITNETQHSLLKMATPRSSLFSSFLGLVLFGGNRAYAFIVGRRDRSTVGKDSIPSAILVLVASAMLLTHLLSLYKQKYSVIVVK